MNTRLWLALHALVAVLPAIGAVARAPDAKLFGIEVPPVQPVWSASGWRAEQVQPAFQAWFEANVGFRGAMVRTDNTVQAFVVGEPKPSGNLVEGEERTLFLKDDVWFMSKRKHELAQAVTSLDAQAARLGSLQRKLAARGKKLVVVIAPSKTVVYPDEVPAGWRRRGLRSDLDMHAALRASLERNGVAFADGHQLMVDKRGEERELLFARTGRHWTTLGACLVLREALVDGPVTPSCAYEMAPTDWTENLDFDLYRLLNVWRMPLGHVVGPRLKERGKAEGAASTPRPRTLFVGSSFMWMLAEVMRPLVEAPIAFYYNLTVYDVSETLRPIEPVDPTSPRWTGYAVERDLYVIEMLETYAHGDQITKFCETLERRLDD